MRIAVFHNLTSGGAKRAMFEELKRLSADHSLDVYTTSSANHDFADIRPFVNLHVVFDFEPRPLLQSPFGRLNQLIRLVDLQTMRSVCRQIAKEIDSGGYDVLFMQPCRIEGCSSVARYVRKTPPVYYCHEPLRIVYEKSPWRPYDRGEAVHRRMLNRIDPLPGIYRRALRRGDKKNVRSVRRMLVNSKNIQTAAREIYGVEPFLSYHGVDSDFFHPQERERTNTVLSVGSLTPLKGFDFLIEALATIPSTLRPELVIASNFQNPPEREYLEQLAGQSGVVLKLMGNVSDERLLELYNQAGVVGYAPIREPFGFVSLEAMACATPIVGVAEGGLLETVIPGKTGCLVERDPERFGQAINELLSSPKQAEALGKAGRAYVVENWTWEKAVRELENYLLM